MDTPPPPRPLSRTAATIIAHWEQATGISPVHVEDTFGDLGGTSLALENALVALRGALGRDIPTDFLADDPTVAELARRIEDSAATDFRGRVPTTAHLSQGSAGEVPVFMFAGAGASAVSFLPLARYLQAGAGGNPACDCWAFQARGFHSRGWADMTLRAKARRHLAEIQRIQPTGPVILLGHSFGGHVALEAARQLQARGREVRAVILLDSLLKEPDRQSVASHLVAEPTTGSRWGWWHRLVTHAKIYTAGLIRYDVPAHQAVFWEQEIRIQNRIRLAGVPAGTTLLVSADGLPQEPLWRDLDPAPEIIRVQGSHLGVLTSPEVFRSVAALVAAAQN